MLVGLSREAAAGNQETQNTLAEMGRFAATRIGGLARGGIDVQALCPSLAKDLREGATTAGGYLVPTEQAGEVLNLVNNFSAVKSLCRQVPMAGRQITFPTISGGLTAYWVPEATDTETYGLGDGAANGEKPRSDATFGQLALTAHVLAVKVVVSNQLSGRFGPRRGPGAAGTCLPRPSARPLTWPACGARARPPTPSPAWRARSPPTP